MAYRCQTKLPHRLSGYCFTFYRWIYDDAFRKRLCHQQFKGNAAPITHYIYGFGSWLAYYHAPDWTLERQNRQIQTLYHRFRLDGYYDSCLYQPSRYSIVDDYHI